MFGVVQLGGQLGFAEEFSAGAGVAAVLQQEHWVQVHAYGALVTQAWVGKSRRLSFAGKTQMQSCKRTFAGKQVQVRLCGGGAIDAQRLHACRRLRGLHHARVSSSNIET